MADTRTPLMARHPAAHRPLPRTLANATILQIVPSLRDEPVARIAVETACGLMQSGARALIAGTPGALAGKLQTAGGEWIPFSNKTMNPLTLYANAARLKKLIATERIDVVHAYGAGAAWSALSATAHLPVWLVTSLPDTPPSGRLRTFFLGALARGDRVIASSSHAAGRNIRHFDIPPDRVAVVPHSIDTHLFDPAGVDRRRIEAVRGAARLDPEERMVLVPGRIAAGHGQHVLVEAAAILAQRGLGRCVFVLAGDDRNDRAYTHALTARIRKLGLEAVFSITALRDRPAALSAARLVVLPALESPRTGRAAIEAQAMARPVITSGVGVLPETLLAPPRMPDELRTGWLVRPGDPVELAGALGVALQLDDTAYRALAARARQFAQYMFSPESVVRATRAVYTALLARDR